VVCEVAGHLDQFGLGRVVAVELDEAGGLHQVELPGVRSAMAVSDSMATVAAATVSLVIESSLATLVTDTPSRSSWLIPRARSPLLALTGGR
jgi:hypothetical protein